MMAWPDALRGGPSLCCNSRGYSNPALARVRVRGERGIALGPAISSDLMPLANVYLLIPVGPLNDRLAHLRPSAMRTLPYATNGF